MSAGKYLLRSDSTQDWARTGIGRAQSLGRSFPTTEHERPVGGARTPVSMPSAAYIAGTCAGLSCSSEWAIRGAMCGPNTSSSSPSPRAFLVCLRLNDAIRRIASFNPFPLRFFFFPCGAPPSALGPPVASDACDSPLPVDDRTLSGFPTTESSPRTLRTVCESSIRRLAGTSATESCRVSLLKAPTWLRSRSPFLCRHDRQRARQIVRRRRAGNMTPRKAHLPVALKVQNGSATRASTGAKEHRSKDERRSFAKKPRIGRCAPP